MPCHAIPYHIIPYGTIPYQSSNAGYGPEHKAAVSDAVIALVLGNVRALDRL